MKFKSGDRVQSQRSNRFGTVIGFMNKTSVIVKTDTGENVLISPKILDLVEVSPFNPVSVQGKLF